ncbi:MAG: hypothetical protein KDK23_06610 [Leptospiraceae bacterium]|nr:hypothetical protein [Leptospiraceae bacterium]
MNGKKSSKYADAESLREVPRKARFRCPRTRMVLLPGVMVGLLVCLIAMKPASAESPMEQPDKREELNRQANELRSMSAAEARERIKSMNLSQAMSIYDLLVQDAQQRGVGPQVFYAAEQIQLLKATADSQKRLESLIWVIVLTLILFSGYLTYVLVDQRRLYKRMEELRSSAARSGNGPSAPADVYRGE